MASTVLPVLTLVESRKRDQVLQILKTWKGMDFGDYEPCLIFGAEDSDEDLNNEIGDLMKSWSPLAVTGSGAETVPGLAEIDVLRDVNHVAWYHRMAVMREALRRAALDSLPRFDFALWIDADITTTFPDGVLRLIRFLKESTGPYAPQVVGALCCGRMSGMPTIFRWSGIQAGRPLADLSWGHPSLVGYTGFGCTLMTYRALSQVPFDTYAEARSRIEAQDPTLPTGAQHTGEDVYWFHEHHVRLQCPVYVHAGVPTRHWHLDGSFWEPHTDMKTGQIVPIFNTSVVDQSRQVWVHNPGPGVFENPAFKIRLNPGQDLLVSPDMALSWVGRNSPLKEGRAPVPEDIAAQVAKLVPASLSQSGQMRERLAALRRKPENQPESCPQEAAAG